MKKSEKKGLAWLLLIIIILGNLDIFIGIVVIAIIIVSIIFLINLSIKTYQKEKYESMVLKSGISEVDEMSGLEFEYYLSLLLGELEFKVVKITPASGDYGADLIVKDQDGTKIAIQAKRYKNSVGLKAVQEIVAALSYYNCEKGMVITNSFLSQSAKKLAEANNIELWERELLMQKLLDVKRK